MPRKRISKFVVTSSNDVAASIFEKPAATTTVSSENSSDKAEMSSDVIDVNELRGKEVDYYQMLYNFFIKCDVIQIQRMIDIINGDHDFISLRFLDWFVTRYCYLYKLSVDVSNTYTDSKNFNINISYKAQLKSFRKEYFDPFKRKKKFNFELEKHDVSFLTTIGQLNFFRWCIVNDVINYTELNYESIIAKYDHTNSYFKKTTVASDDSKTIDSRSSETKSDSNDSKYKMPQVSRNIHLEI
ncbi:MAG: hypothetical protein Gaeavirus6_8 [Gaeavirus sp.]|uniref:Uncharacterized protein n=1 Tax=Gaeavirus sp. TaxID=2487767 RepID=A0A3G5A2H0_9VIRU|nr:MAG: hypothetical protein Gaeavirus6_8 [Gaeavirus sp.]